MRLKCIGHAVSLLFSRVCIILVTQVNVQHGELLHEWVCYFYEPKASQNAPNKCSIHANECSEMSLPPQCCLFSHKMPSNSPFSAWILIKARCGC